MKLRRLVPLTLALSLMLVFMPNLSNADQTKTLRFAHFATDNELAIHDRFFAEQVYKRTNGRYKVEIFWANQLAKTKELIGLVKNGTIDMAAIVPGYYPSQFPLWCAPNSIPFAVKSMEALQEIAKRIPEEVPAVKKEIEEQNLKILFAHGIPNYHLFAIKPATKFEDLKGLKLRSYGTYLPKAFDAVGAVGVTVYPAESYEALQRKVIHGAIWTIQAGYNYRSHEVAKHVSLWNIMSILGWNHMINLDVWKKIPPDVQQIFLEIEKETYEVDRKATSDFEKENIKKLKAEGAIFYEVQETERQKWIKACPDFFEEWIKSCEKVGKGEGSRQMKKIWQEIVKKYDK